MKAKKKPMLYMSKGISMSDLKENNLGPNNELNDDIEQDNISENKRNSNLHKLNPSMITEKAYSEKDALKNIKEQENKSSKKSATNYSQPCFYVKNKADGIKKKEYEQYSQNISRIEKELENDTLGNFGNESIDQRDIVLKDRLQDIFQDNKSLNISELIGVYEDQLRQKDSEIDFYNRKVYSQQKNFIEKMKIYDSKIDNINSKSSEIPPNYIQKLQVLEHEISKLKKEKNLTKQTESIPVSCNILKSSEPSEIVSNKLSENPSEVEILKKKVELLEKQQSDKNSPREINMSNENQIIKEKPIETSKKREPVNKILPEKKIVSSNYLRPVKPISSPDNELKDAFSKKHFSSHFSNSSKPKSTGMSALNIQNTKLPEIPEENADYTIQNNFIIKPDKEVLGSRLLTPKNSSKIEPKFPDNEVSQNIIQRVHTDDEVPVDPSPLHPNSKGINFKIISTTRPRVISKNYLVPTRYGDRKKNAKTFDHDNRIFDIKMAINDSNNVSHQISESIDNPYLKNPEKETFGPRKLYLKSGQNKSVGDLLNISGKYHYNQKQKYQSDIPGEYETYGTTRNTFKGKNISNSNKKAMFFAKQKSIGLYDFNKRSAVFDSFHSDQRIIARSDSNQKRDSSSKSSQKNRVTFKNVDDDSYMTNNEKCRTDKKLEKHVESTGKLHSIIKNKHNINMSQLNVGRSFKDFMEIPNENSSYKVKGNTFKSPGLMDIFHDYKRVASNEYSNIKKMIIDTGINNPKDKKVGSHRVKSKIIGALNIKEPGEDMNIPLKNLITGLNEYGQVDDEVADEGPKWEVGSQKNYRIPLSRDKDNQTFKSVHTILSYRNSESDIDQNSNDLKKSMRKTNSLMDVPRISRIFENENQEVNECIVKETKMSDLNKSNVRHLRWTGEDDFNDGIEYSTVNVKGRIRKDWSTASLPNKKYVDKFDYESSEDIISVDHIKLDAEFIESIREKDQLAVRLMDIGMDPKIMIDITNDERKAIEKVANNLEDCQTVLTNGNYIKFGQAFLQLLQTLAYIDKTTRWGSTHPSISSNVKQTGKFVIGFGRSIPLRYNHFKDIYNTKLDPKVCVNLSKLEMSCDKLDSKSNMLYFSCRLRLNINILNLLTILNEPMYFKYWMPFTKNVEKIWKKENQYHFSSAEIDMPFIKKKSFNFFSYQLDMLKHDNCIFFDQFTTCEDSNNLVSSELRDFLNNMIKEKTKKSIFSIKGLFMQISPWHNIWDIKFQLILNPNLSSLPNTVNIWNAKKFAREFITNLMKRCDDKLFNESAWVKIKNDLKSKKFNEYWLNSVKETITENEYRKKIADSKKKRSLS